jgi:hypothetical protein
MNTTQIGRWDFLKTTGLARLLRQTDALPDKMPLDEGVNMELPEESIR